MAKSVCVNHTDRTANHRCVSCHKPICDECVRQDANGTFCSADCSENYSKFHARYKGESKGGFFAAIKTYITSIIMLALLGAIAIYTGAKILKIGFLQNLLKSFGL